MESALDILPPFTADTDAESELSLEEDTSESAFLSALLAANISTHDAVKQGIPFLFSSLSSLRLFTSSLENAQFLLRTA